MEAAQQLAVGPKPSIIKRLSAKCARHGSACLAIIIILVIIVIAQRVYYQGFLMFGPYFSTGSSTKSKPKKKQQDSSDEGKTDSETADLIQSINSAGGE